MCRDLKSGQKKLFVVTRGLDKLIQYSDFIQDERLRLPLSQKTITQFVIFKPLSYCFQETIGFDIKASFASRPESRLIR